MQNPEGHRETLHEMGATLRDEGLIEQFEQFDMNEMADAAYWHAVEELQNSRAVTAAHQPMTSCRSNGKLLGTISRSILNFADD